VGKPTPPLLGPGLFSRCIEVRTSDVVFVRALLEAHDGLGCLFSEKGGELTLGAPLGREAELAEFLRDLAEEIPVWGPDAPVKAASDPGPFPTV
jgi:hypothetical protein